MLARVPRDVWIGLAMLVAAVLYWRTADAIPISPLDGVVNAGAMPKALAWALGALAVLLIVRALSVEAMAASARAKPAAAGDGAPDEGEGRVSLAEHLKALGIPAFALGYILLLPVLGYAVSVALLVALVSLYGGARLDWRIPAVGAGAAACFYIVFVLLLGIPLPAGFWPSLL